jgi:hypothetical protein
LTTFKNIEEDQNIFNTFKKEFELADGLGISELWIEVPLHLILFTSRLGHDHTYFPKIMTR